MATVRQIGLFPWCFDPSTSVFSYTGLRERAVPMWWKGKRWKLSVTFVRQANSDPVVIDTLTGEDYFDVRDLYVNTIDGKTYATETDLVCAGKYYDAESATTYSLAADHFWPTTAGISLTDASIKIGPNLEFLFDTDDLVGVSSSGTGTELGKINVIVDGVNFDIPLKAISMPYTGGLYEVVSFNGTLEAVETWAFA